MATIRINTFGPSALQIAEAALGIALHPESKLVVVNKPEGGTVLGGAEYEGRRKKDYDRGLAYLHDMANRSTLKNQVFLGGACDPTTWRQDIAVPLLEKAGVAFYNPQVPDWDAKDAEYKAQGIKGGILEVEAEHKLTSATLLFVFDPLTRGIATLNEAIEFMMAGKQNVILVEAYVQAGTDVGEQKLTVEEANDINLARKFLFEVADAYGISVCADVETAIEECIEVCQREVQDVDIEDYKAEVG